MKLTFNTPDKHQPDPFIFEDNGKFYLYVTAMDGVEAYSATDIFGEWHFEGIVGSVDNRCDYWAPSVILYQDTYYLYVSCWAKNQSQYMHVLSAKSPLGPFTNPKCLYDHFSIDSHVVETEAGLFLWYAKNNTNCVLKGTRLFVDKLLDPYTPAYEPREMLVPTFEEERFLLDQNHYTLEGAFWFQEGDWQYLMYSGGNYQNDTYHVGYAAAKTNEPDLTKVEFIKHTENGHFSPVLIKNEFEEGTGHHSVIKYQGQYYAIYHARDHRDLADDTYVEQRTARICKLHVKDGIITAERYPDRI